MSVYFSLLWVGLSNCCVCIMVLGGSVSAGNITAFLGKSLVLPCVSERVKPLGQEMGLHFPAISHVC